MAIDFEAMAAAAAALQQAKEAAEVEKLKQEKRDRKAIASGSVDLLTKNLLPIIENAQNAFTRYGVIFEVKKEFDIEHLATPNPTIIVQLKQRAIGRSDNYFICGRFGFFSCKDAKTVIAEISGEHAQRPEVKLGQSPSEDFEALIEKTVKRIVGTFYEAVSEFKRKAPYG